MINLFKKYKDILGVNARNLLYIKPYNKKSGFKLADNKIATKKIFKKHKIPCPKTYKVLNDLNDLKNCDWDDLPNSFVLKPAEGFAGKGIIVVFSRKKKERNTWIKSDGSLVTKEKIKKHILEILSGTFSLHGQKDSVFFEERIQVPREFKPYSFRGIPDIRVIVFNKVPVMGMIRFPTKKSEGKANLMQGGIGVGIDMANGITTTAIYGKNNIIEKNPDSGLLLSGIKIPYWDEILKMSIETQEISKLGYLGLDIIIDRKKGPLVLELNARPGLSIQIANLDGLKRRLERVSDLKIESITRSVSLAKSLFGGEIDQQIKEASGKSVIGKIEKIEIFGENNISKKVIGIIDTGASMSSIDLELAKKIGFSKLIKQISEINFLKYGEIKNKNDGKKILKELRKNWKNKIEGIENFVIVWSSHGVSIRPVIKIKIILNKKTIYIKANITNREKLKYPILIGRQDLNNFLIDVTKNKYK